MVLDLPVLATETQKVATTTAGSGFSFPNLSPQMMAILVVAGVVLVFALMQYQRSKE